MFVFGEHLRHSTTYLLIDLNVPFQSRKKSGLHCLMGKLESLLFFSSGLSNRKRREQAGAEGEGKGLRKA